VTASSSSRPPYLSGKSGIWTFIYLAIAIVSGLGLLGKVQLVHRIFPVPYSALYCVLGGWVLLPLCWLLALRWKSLAAPMVLFGVVVASLFVYPRMADLQKMGRGSDQADCVIVAAKQLGAAQWPYDISKMWSRDPMSCGPGWVLLQTPSILAVGYRWNLLLLWALALLILRIHRSSEGIAGMLSLLGLPAVVWVAASDGTDFLTFGILLAALFVTLEVDTRFTPILLLLLSLVVQFRFPMVILPVLLLRRSRLIQGICVSLLAFICQLVFLVWRPAAFISDGPLHLFYKLTQTNLLPQGLWAAVGEVCLVFACMLGVSFLVRRSTSVRWLGFAYLLLLTVPPAVLDFARKYHSYGSVMPALGLWEGANWLSGCLPLAVLFLPFSKWSASYAVEDRGSEHKSRTASGVGTSVELPV
jgi:hypothetical protein